MDRPTRPNANAESGMPMFPEFGNVLAKTNDERLGSVSPMARPTASERVSMANV